MHNNLKCLSVNDKLYLERAVIHMTNNTKFLLFRCTEETKRIIETKARDQGLTINSFLEKKLLATDDKLDQSYSADVPVAFSVPEQLGNIVTLSGDQYLLVDGDIRLTDNFLDEMLFLNEYKPFPKEYSFAGRKDYADPLKIMFDENYLVVSRNNVSTTYEIPFKAFFSAFIDNIKKYTLYYAAPCNYRILFYNNFDVMVQKMVKYRDLESRILSKI